MGTRADFYVGVGVDAEWLGSIAFDGYPKGIEPRILHAQNEAGYRQVVKEFVAQSDHGTTPEQGWPWPWEDSRTTDYAYAWTPRGEVRASCFGHAWFDPTKEQTDEEMQEEQSLGKVVAFPDMSKRQSVAHGHRSGTIVVSRDSTGRLSVE